MVQGWRAGGVDLTDVTVIRPSGTPVPGVRTMTQYPDETQRRRAEHPEVMQLSARIREIDSQINTLAGSIRNSIGTVTSERMGSLLTISIRPR